MGVPQKYWRWIRLTADGTCRVEEAAPLRAFFQQQFPDWVEATEISDRQAQCHLIYLLRTETNLPAVRLQAEQCLRCYISQQIFDICRELKQKFGTQGGFTELDLFPLVLDDVDRSTPLTLESNPSSAYQAFAAKILKDFDPEKSLLSTWTKFKLMQHKPLEEFLGECGIRLESDWAILNRVRPGSLPRVLAGKLSPTQIGEMQLLLESYHAVYRGDRRQRNRAGQRCLPPTVEQLQRMVNDLQEKNKSIAPADLFEKLRTLARLLRPNHRNATESIDEQGADRYRAPDPDEDEPDMFLKIYFQEFLTCLEGAIEQTIRDRLAYLHQKKPPKDEAFAMALFLFYCELRSMTEIAPLIQLQKQYQVTRLLKLDDLRADVRRHTIDQMRRQERMKDQMGDYFNPDRLTQLDEQLDAALKQIIDQATAEASNPNRSNQSLFAQRLCQCLDNWRTS